MLPPMFYNFSTMTVFQWFEMLSYDDLQESRTHVYRIDASEPFEIDQVEQEAGIYYIRTVKDTIEQFEPFCTVSKLSFSEIVYLSDIFSRVVPLIFPTDDEFTKLVETGGVAKLFENEVPSMRGLESLRVKIGAKYFDNSWMGAVRRVFSALINFFRKYNLYIKTGIYWPGNSCHYADKVVAKINHIKLAFAKTALEVSKEVLSDRLEISLEQLESMDIGQLKKIYHKKVLAVHSDKNHTDPLAADKFQEINQVWGDFNELVKLCDGMRHNTNDESDEMSPVITKGSLPNNLFQRHHKKILMLTASAIVDVD